MVDAENVTVIEPDGRARAALAEKLAKVGAGAAAILADASGIEGASTVVLAVVPQVMPAVLASLKGKVQADQLVMSIAAGVELQTLENGLGGHKTLIRVMPNTPAQVGQGVAAWFAAPAVSEAQKADARSILQAIGSELEVDREAYMDMVTAVSGSGPAWIMLMLEAMIDAGVQIGLKPDWARELAMQTMTGSVALARETGLHTAQLKNMVTTPGGTTAAGLFAMEKAGVPAGIMEGILAAYRRGQELGAAARK